MKIQHWTAQDRPREKLLRLGGQSLSDAELLAIFLRTGVAGANAVELAQRLLDEFGSLRDLLNASKTHFCNVKGLGAAKYAQLQAVLEMSKRYLAEPLKRERNLDSVQQTKSFLISQLRDEPNEVFAVLFLDSQYRLIQFKKLFFGTINAASVYPRVIVQHALALNAGAIIVSHNHPSGLSQPSHADKYITQRIVQTMELIDVKVLDHIVIGDGHCESFAEMGLI